MVQGVDTAPLLRKAMTTTSITATEDSSTDLPQRFTIRIAGKVQHRVGDGPIADLPIGQQIEVDTAIGSMVLSWTHDEQPINVTIAREEFLLYVEEGSIQIVA